MKEHTGALSAKDVAFARYKKAYGCTTSECEELYTYDTKYCGSDSSAREYLLDVCNLRAAEVNAYFGKVNRLLGDSPKEISKATIAKTSEEQATRVTFIASKLAQEYSFLFPTLIARTDSSLTYKTAEGKTLDIKVMKHKTEQVISREVKRVGIKKNDRGKPIPTAATDNELRCMALENVLREDPDLFIALAAAGSKFGYIIPDNAKYPFGSVKITHHK